MENRNILGSVRRKIKRAYVNRFAKETWLNTTFLGFRWKLDRTKYIDNLLLNEQLFEKETVGLLDRFLKPGMTVLDVGANFGYFTLLMSRIVGNEGKIHAFEPVSEYFQRLTGHVNLNGIENVETYQFGLSDQELELEISIGECSATLHYTSDIPPRSMETIRLKVLDQWWFEEGPGSQVDFIKVDIDGHEPLFLAGAREIIHKHRPVLLMEVSQDNLFKNQSTAWEFYKQLEALGYELISERTGVKFPDLRSYLMEAGNFTHSANIFALPVGADK